MKTDELQTMRERSWHTVRKAGFEQNPDLPLLEEGLIPQSAGPVADRLLCMSLVAAHAYGYPLERALAWLDREGLRAALSPREQAFLAGDMNQLMLCQRQVDSIYTLTWSLSTIETFSVTGKMPDDLIDRLPDFRNNKGSAEFRLRLKLRPLPELLQQLDTAYCFHWAYRDAYLSSNGKVKGDMFGVIERRRALEWLFHGGSWDDVSLDT